MIADSEEDGFKDDIDLKEETIERPAGTCLQDTLVAAVLSMIYEWMKGLVFICIIQQNVVNN